MFQTLGVAERLGSRDDGLGAPCQRAPGSLGIVVVAHDDEHHDERNHRRQQRPAPKLGVATRSGPTAATGFGPTCRRFRAL